MRNNFFSSGSGKNLGRALCAAFSYYDLVTTNNLLGVIHSVVLRGVALPGTTVRTVVPSGYLLFFIIHYL